MGVRCDQVKRGRRGFTLAELLVGLALLGIIGTVVSRLMLDQQRFFFRTNEQLGVRRELRSAATLLPADLRSISSVGGDLLTFSSTQVTFRMTFGSAVVCAKPDSLTLDLPPKNAVRTTLTTWITIPRVGDTVFVYNTTDAGAESWTAHRLTSVTNSTGLCAGSAFLDNSLDAGKDRWRLTVTPGLPDLVAAGSVVRFTRPTRYALTQQASGRWYLDRTELRDDAWTAATVVAGPFSAGDSSGTGGIGFTMFDSTGAAIATTGNTRAVSRIDIMLRGAGADASGAVAGTSSSKDSLRLRVALRNRQ